jgi:hypothetical protein
MALGHSVELGAQSRISAHRASALATSPLSNAVLPSSNCLDTASGVALCLGHVVRFSIAVHGRATNVNITKASNLKFTWILLLSRTLRGVRLADMTQWRLY